MFRLYVVRAAEVFVRARLAGCVSLWFRAISYYVVANFTNIGFTIYSNHCRSVSSPPRLAMISLLILLSSALPLIGTPFGDFFNISFSLPAGLLRSGKLPVLNLRTGQMNQHFRPHMGRLVALICVIFGTAERHVGPLGQAKFHANRCPGVGMRPQNDNNFHFLVKSRPAEANPLTDLYSY